MQAVRIDTSIKICMCMVVFKPRHPQFISMFLKSNEVNAVINIIKMKQMTAEAP